MKGYEAAIILGAAAVGLMLGVSLALADPGPVVAEAEKDGVDLLYAALAALVAAGGGLFVKRPQDVIRERRAQNGTQAAPAGNGRVDAGQRALDELAQHEEHCRERTKAVYGRIDGVEARLAGVERTVADVKADTAYIRGLLEGRQKQ